MKMYVLRGWNAAARFPEDRELEQFFTAGEHQLALQVAQRWLKRGLQPFLYSISTEGTVKVWVNYASARRKAA